MELRFKQKKTAQAAAFLLSLSGGRMGVLRLMKLLYFADRASLLRSGRPLSFDTYFSLPHGPILQATLDLINHPGRYDRDSNYWSDVISERRGNTIQLLQNPPPNDELSPADEQVLRDVFADVGHLTSSQVRRRSHQLPEYCDPGKGRLPISIEDILEHSGFSEEERLDIVAALRSESYLTH